MRCLLIAIPLAFVAAPAVAAPAPQPELIQIPSELTDPAFAARIARMTESLSKALLNLPIGEIEAAAEGRPVTEADRRRTVRDVGRLSDPHFERDLEQEIASARPRVESAMQAFARALPAMTRALSEVAEQVERATANMPQPGYPRR